MRVKIDASLTFLFLCECGARGEAEPTRMDALQDARAHELRAHPQDKDVLRQVNNQRARDKQKMLTFVERIPNRAT